MRKVFTLFLSVLLVSCGGGRAMSVFPRQAESSVEHVHTINFEPSKARLKPMDRARLANIAADLFTYPEKMVSIVGHSDEKGGSGYNVILGWRRAHAVTKALQEMGVTRSRIMELSYGAEKPEDARHTDSAWKKNRRVEIYTLG